jgi:hypothetical protein
VGLGSDLSMTTLAGQELHQRNTTMGLCGKNSRPTGFEPVSTHPFSSILISTCLRLAQGARQTARYFYEVVAIRGGWSTRHFRRQHVEAVLPLAAEKALTTPGHVPTRLEAYQGGSVGTWGTGEFTEQNFLYVFRLDKDGNSWLLPAEEYPRVIRSVYSDTLNAVGKGGRKVMECKCEGSTFLIRYKAAIGGRSTTGTIHGWVGPENAKSAHSVISVGVREETEGK